jgi:hypothetical protein
MVLHQLIKFTVRRLSIRLSSRAPILFALLTLVVGLIIVQRVSRLRSLKIKQAVILDANELSISPIIKQ